MPDTTTTNDATETDVQQTDTTTEDVDQADTPEVTAETEDTTTEDDTGLSRRDIRYREQLRAAEAERDTLRTTVESMQRREVERLAADHLVKPASLWTVGTELASLINEDGTVDPERVATAAKDARQQHGLEDPQSARRRGPVVPREGSSVTSGGHKNSSWTDAFKLD